jgi:hypothetical protein
MSRSCQVEIGRFHRSNHQVRSCNNVFYSDPNPERLERPYFALGLEGSANKLGAGIIKHAEDGSTSVLSNVRHTYITPPGEGFQPRDTAQHHRDWAINVIKDAINKAGLSMQSLDCICYTKGLPFLVFLIGPFVQLHR